MALSQPPYLDEAQQTEATYKWSSELCSGWTYDGNAALERAIAKLSPQGEMVLLAGVSEWIVWRLMRAARAADIQDALLRVEALWAAAIDPALVDMPECTWKVTGTRKEAAQGALVFMDMNLQGALADYRLPEDNTVCGFLVAQTLLATHILPKKKVFKDWFDARLRRLLKLYPDKSRKPAPPVARELVLAERTPTLADLQEHQRAFLRSLESSKNPYLVRKAHAKGRTRAS
ncbi:hypothetical protein P2318_00360 [Myxococcaceae bacterium GXIMD 01537]